jgi:hypothetical protein
MRYKHQGRLPLISSYLPGKLHIHIYKRNWAHFLGHAIWKIRKIWALWFPFVSFFSNTFAATGAKGVDSPCPQPVSWNNVPLYSRQMLLWRTTRSTSCPSPTSTHHRWRSTRCSATATSHGGSAGASWTSSKRWCWAFCVDVDVDVWSCVWYPY